MELKEFISSGIIESYLLGTATAEEIRLVNDMAARYPEVEDEIIAVENALLSASEAGIDVFSDNIKKNVLSSIRKNESTSTSLSDANTRDLPVNTAPAGKKIRLFQYAIAASVTLFIASAAVNVFFYSRLQHLDREVARLNEDKLFMANEMETQKASMNQMNTSLAVVTNPENKAVPLKGLEIAPTSSVMVYWNPNTSNVFLHVHDLVPAPEGKQYQLWAIVDGTPVDAGVFDCGNLTGIQAMKNIPNAQAFAITLEQKGGSPVPQGSMYLLGNV